MSSSIKPTTSQRNQQLRENPTLLVHLYTFIWWTSFAVFTLTMFVWTIILLPFSLVFDPRRRLYHVFSVSFWGWAVYAFNPLWSLRIEGRKKIPWDGRAVLVANHESLADVLVLSATFRPFKFVSKRSVFLVPVLGWAMRFFRYIELERGNRDSVLRMLQDCRDWLEAEVPVMLFPEGTRSPDGSVLPFKDGAFQVAIETDSPIYPIVLAGTHDALPKHGLIPPISSHVRVRVLDPVLPADHDHDIDKLRDHVRALIVAEKPLLDEHRALELAA